MCRCVVCVVCGCVVCRCEVCGVQVCGVRCVVCKCVVCGLLPLCADGAHVCLESPSPLVISARLTDYEANKTYCTSLTFYRKYRLTLTHLTPWTAAAAAGASMCVLHFACVGTLVRCLFLPCRQRQRSLCVCPGQHHAGLPDSSVSHPERAPHLVGVVVYRLQCLPCSQPFHTVCVVCLNISVLTHSTSSGSKLRTLLSVCL